MPNVPGWTSIANVGGAFGLINQTPGYIDQSTLTPSYVGAIVIDDADPTDTVDSTSVFNNAIATAESNAHNQDGLVAIIVPGGSYRIDGSLLGPGLEFTGGGGIFFGSLAPAFGNKAPVVLNFSNQISQGLYVENAAGNNYNGLMLSGLRLVGPGNSVIAGQPTYGLACYSGQRIIVQDCQIEQFQVGMTFDNIVPAAHPTGLTANDITLNRVHTLIPNLTSGIPTGLQCGVLNSNPGTVTNDVHYLDAHRLSFVFQPGGPTQESYGIWAGRLDTSTFYDTYWLNTNSNVSCIVSDHTQISPGSFPSDLRFLGVDFTYSLQASHPNPIAVLGTPSTNNQNYVTGLCWENNYTISTGNRVNSNWNTPWTNNTPNLISQVPAIPATGVAYQNPNFMAANVFLISTGGVTTVTIGGNQVGTAAGNGSSFYLPALTDITLSYTGGTTPNWVWSAAPLGLG